MKKIFLIISAFAVLSQLVFLSSCKDDETVGAPYLKLSNRVVNSAAEVITPSDMGFQLVPNVKDETSSLITYDIRSNSDWRIDLEWELDTESDWLMPYPIQGSGDGKLRFCAKANDGLHSRSALAKMLYSDGTETGVSFTITQNANTPYLTVTIGSKEATRVSNGRPAGEYKLQVATNIDFVCSLGGGDWFGTREEPGNIFYVMFDELSEGIELREGYLTFKGIAPHGDIEKTLKIVQSAQSFGDAELVTIEELLSGLPAGGGIVDKNIYIEGYVVSDKSGKNIPDNVMVVQDGSKRGIVFEYDDAVENTYTLGTKMKVWMVDKEVRLNTAKEFTSNETVFDADPVATGYEKVLRVIDNLNDKDKIVGTWVQITNAEWVFPYGTYYPGDENSCYTATTAVGYSADKARLVRSAGGGSIRAYVLGGKSIDDGAVFKHAQILPKGSGVLTGVLMNRPDDYEKTTQMTILRMMQAKDDAIPAIGARAYSNIVEFVWAPFSMTEVTPIIPSSGTGKLYNSMDDKWHFPTHATGENYNGYNYWRTDATKQAFGNVDPGLSSTYVGLNINNWDGTNANSIFKGKYPMNPGGVIGEAWIVEFSTANVGAGDELSIAFCSSSSGTGPREFVIDWGESLDGAFTEVAKYDVVNWDAQHYPPEFMFTLPEACNGKANIIVRMRVCGSQRANLGATTTAFAPGGTNRLCGLVVSKRSK